MARRLRGPIPGFTILELLFALAITGTLTAIAVPQGLRALDDFRTRAAARYLAQRLADARLSAIKRSLAQGLRFEPGSPDYRITAVAGLSLPETPPLELPRRSVGPTWTRDRFLRVLQRDFEQLPVCRDNP